MDETALCLPLAHAKVFINANFFTTHFFISEVKNSLKFKKIDETKTMLKNIVQVVIQNETELRNVEKHHRDIDSEENNVLKNLEIIKNNIKNFEKLAKNKFRKVVETETNTISSY